MRSIWPQVDKADLDQFFLDPSCILYLPLWRLDGAQFADKSAYGYLATNFGSLGTPQGRQFDGVDDYVDVPTSSVLHFGSSDWTVEVYFKPLVKRDNYAEIFNMSGGQGGAARELRFFIDNVNQFASTIKGALATIWNGALSTETLMLDRWYHWAITRSGADFAWYKEGVHMGIFATSTDSLFDSGLSTRLGGAGDGYFQGFIALTAAYRRVLAAPEIQRHYLALKGVLP